MTNRELAAQHAAAAEKLVHEAESTWKGPVGAAKGSAASAHGALALYYQREADREGA